MRIRSIILIPLLFSSFMFFAAGCRDCSKDKPNQIILPQRVLDFVDFKAGTYWIYQDSATGRIDSEIVATSKHVWEDKVASNQCGEVAVTSQYENINIRIERYDTLGNLTFAGILEFNNSYKWNNPKQNNVFIIDSYNSFTIGYPFELTYYVGSYKCTETYSDSLLINGKIYYNVLTILREEIDAPDNKQIILRAKKIGKIQVRSIIPGHPDYVINLLRYKIN